MLISIIRFNSYIFYVSHSKKIKNYKAVINHKYFLIKFSWIFLNKSKHDDSKRQVKIEKEEYETETDTSGPQKTQSKTFKEEEADNELEVKVKKIRKVGKMSKKNKPVLTSKISNNTDELH